MEPFIIRDVMFLVIIALGIGLLLYIAIQKTKSKNDGYSHDQNTQEVENLHNEIVEINPPPTNVGFGMGPGLYGSGRHFTEF